MRYLSLFLLAFLAACSTDYEESDELTPMKRDDRKYKGIGKLFGDEPIQVGGGPKRGGDEDAGMGVNSYLWRSTLDTLSFMPLVSADPFGGIIVTDWYVAPEAPQTRIKATVYILSRQLRSDGVRVTLLRQEKQNGQWMDVPADPKTARHLENTILSHARTFRSHSK